MQGRRQEWACCPLAFGKIACPPTTVQRQCPRLWTLGYHDGFHKTVVAGQPATRPGRCQNIIHNASTTLPRHDIATAVSTKPSWQGDQQHAHNSATTPSTTLPRHDSATTVSTNRRFIVKNRPRNRRGKATSSTPTTVPRRRPRCIHDTSMPL